MKRYTEKYISIWKDSLWVRCPKCQGIAHITYTQEGAEVQCTNCSFHTIQKDLQYFEAIAALNCPNCGTPIKYSQKRLKEKRKLVMVECTHCHQTHEVKPRYETYYEPFPSEDSGLWCDDIFGLPYYFQENVRGNLFWAKNLTHLNVMEDYISSDLREREGMTMVAKLPTFVKLRKNRALLLKILRRWKEQLQLPQTDTSLKPSIMLFFQEKEINITSYLEGLDFYGSYCHITIHTFHKKGTRHWTQFVRNNRLLRALSKEECADIPLEKPECFLVEYSNADFGKEVFTHFLQRYLQTNPPGSLYIDMGDTLYSDRELYSFLLKYPDWDWNKDRQ